MALDGMAVRSLTLLSRSYCHLCDDMLAALQPLQAHMGFSVRVVDVDDHPELETRYGQRVPVLLDGETEICHYHFDLEKLGAHLAAIE